MNLKITDLKNKHFYIAFVALGLLCLIVSWQSPRTQEAVEEAPRDSVDTFIPAGLVLVPLEISNSEALAALVGEMGCVVDF